MIAIDPEHTGTPPTQRGPSLTIHLRKRNPETPFDINETALEAGRRRRRIEDIKEAARLERETLAEVWQ